MLSQHRQAMSTTLGIMRKAAPVQSEILLLMQMFYKSARVEYHPLGVVGAIVPWNYPFHNVFNPLTAALFAGNALVIKVKLWCLHLLSMPEHTLVKLPEVRCTCQCQGDMPFTSCRALVYIRMIISSRARSQYRIFIVAMLVHAGVRACLLVKQILWAHHLRSAVCRRCDTHVYL